MTEKYGKKSKDFLPDKILMYIHMFTGKIYLTRKKHNRTYSVMAQCSCVGKSH